MNSEYFFSMIWAAMAAYNAHTTLNAVAEKAWGVASVGVGLTIWTAAFVFAFASRAVNRER